MEFGRVSPTGNIDPTLPPDDKMTEEVLGRLTPSPDEPIRIYVGGTEWGRKNWVGKVYPAGTKEKDFLANYTKQFNTIELNTLFYHLQPRSVIERWASLAGPDFRFCPKFSDTISHKQQLVNVRRDTELFIEQVNYFGRRLGPCFLQLSEQFGTNRAAVLGNYLRELPPDFRVCVELRQKDWFGGHDTPPVKQAGSPAGILQSTWETFRELGIGTVITDTSGRRDVLHMRLTAPVAFIRYVGNNMHPTDLLRIDVWVDRIKSWTDKGLREIYFFTHNPEEQCSPEMCKYVIEQFNKKCGTTLAPPKLIPKQAENLSLFD
ncbi:MAG TPA: DUF72 domain-containing protein [Puia sp.]|jgi:uncharacterized protein YecE (DUF72 family)